MAKVSISDAILLSPVSRQTFYKNYIKTNAITVEIDHLGKKCIDTAELMRVFGPLDLDSLDNTGADTNKHFMTPVLDGHTATLEMEVKLMREQLANATEQIQEYRQREARLLDQVDNLTSALKLIEHKAPEQTLEPARRSFLSRIFGRA